MQQNGEMFGGKLRGQNPDFSREALRKGGYSGTRTRTALHRNVARCGCRLDISCGGPGSCAWVWMDGWRSGPHGFIYVKDAHWLGPQQRQPVAGRQGRGTGSRVPGRGAKCRDSSFLFPAGLLDSAEHRLIKLLNNCTSCKRRADVRGPRLEKGSESISWCGRRGSRAADAPASMEARLCNRRDNRERAGVLRQQQQSQPPCIDQCARGPPRCRALLRLVRGRTHPHTFGKGEENTDG